MARALLVSILLLSGCAHTPPATPAVPTDNYRALWPHVLKAWAPVSSLHLKCVDALDRTVFVEAPRTAVQLHCGTPKKTLRGCASRKGGIHLVSVANHLSQHNKCVTMLHEFFHVIDACHGWPFGRPNGSHPPAVFGTHPESAMSRAVAAGAVAVCTP